MLYILYITTNIVNTKAGGKVGGLFPNELLERSVDYGCSAFFISVYFMAVYGECIHR